MNYHYIDFNQIEEARNSINVQRSAKGEKSISKAAFAAFLSEKRNNTQVAIRQHWFEKCKKVTNGFSDVGVKKEQGLDIVASVKRVYDEYSIKSDLPKLLKISQATA